MAERPVPLTPAQPGRVRQSLWGHADFLRLWAGQTVALFGAQVTLLALPITAIQLLDASAGQLGVLNALEYLPVACVTLLAGVLADRVRRRPLLIGANIGRTLTLAAIPLVYWVSDLSIWVLYAVAFATGIFTAQFDVAYQAYLPSLIDRRLLVEGNSKLQASQSVSQTAGQGASGVLIQLLTAPVAILVNSLAYLVSVVTLVSIRAPEPVLKTTRRSVRADIAEGWRVTLAHPALRIVMLQSAWFNLLWDVVMVVMPLYALRSLHLGAAGLGVVIACGSVGAFGGSLVARRLGHRLGVGPAMAGGMLLACGILVLLPAASGSGAVTLTMLSVAYIVNGCGMTIFNVHSVALRQALVPIELTGRVTATFRFLSWAIIPIGGVSGGQLAEHLGARTALLITVIGLIAGAILFFVAQTVRPAEVPEDHDETRLPAPRPSPADPPAPSATTVPTASKTAAAGPAAPAGDAPQDADRGASDVAPGR